LYNETECSRIGGKAERNAQPSDSAVTGSFASGPEAGAGVVTRATGFAIGELKVVPATNSAETNYPSFRTARLAGPRRAMRDRARVLLHGGCVLIAKTCVSTKLADPAPASVCHIDETYWKN
jgi:hypothetical protein